ncbi:phosphoribosylformylglycinamidine cyclo-ligase [Thalassobacillus sp. CUG 92003]|uniref:phosphoribosylformylglycinamidine cyclo-ligase n=1 Tax=Thalassobacillus sp. CUG 92003 TaxID=2736641 RepID=UPI0015E79FF2|nr:phosphoribosylformylglycinamidine cyclo-ligase [Thalassobacillus sp. CUG 92003]
MSDHYKQSGVDVEAGYRAVDLMKKHVARTSRPEVIGGIGAFAGLFDISSFSYQHPVLVTGTDGVGTKLKLAFLMNRHDTIGVDAVAMCVNDIIAQGADPLLFLDYIACGKNEPDKIEQIVKGIADGCEASGCALVGGETAEMPGVYDEQEYDVAGFVVGMADKAGLITGEHIEAGDCLIGLPSSGVHSNGFSLVRRVVAERELDLNTTYPGLDHPLGEVLLTPTKIYTKAIQAVKQAVTVKGISHITGGGFEENIPRVLPEGLGVQLHRGVWSIPAIFQFLMDHGKLTEDDMYGVFNMGIGMSLVVAQDDVDTALSALQAAGEEPVVMGHVTENQGIQWL